MQDTVGSADIEKQLLKIAFFDIQVQGLQFQIDGRLSISSG